MRRLRRRRVGRDPRGAGRLVTSRYEHAYATFADTEHGLASSSGTILGLVVGLHGLGADERQFGSLLPLQLPAGVAYVGLRAPVDYGGIGFSWYDPLLAAHELEHASVAERVADFVLELRRLLGAEARHTAVVGYSQAAAVAVATSALRPDVAEWFALGSAAVPPGLTALGFGRPDRAFIGVGDKDPFVEVAALEELTAAWDAAGTLVTRHYDIPHVMSPEMAHDISTWLAPAWEPSEPGARWPRVSNEPRS